MLHQVSFAHRKVCRDQWKESSNRGSIAIIAALSFIPMSLILAVVVDAGRSWVVRERLQNGVEAGAVGAAQTWMESGATCNSTSLQIVTADGALPINVVCSSSGTNRNGTVSVSAEEDVVPIFSTLLSRNRVRISASTRVRIGTTSSTSRLRPISLCRENTAVKNWINSGMPAGVTVSVPFLSPTTLCGGDVSGNWTVLDFNGGSSSNSETQDWIANGYDQLISVGDIVYGSPGVPSTSLKFDDIIGKSIIFPMFTTPINLGSNAKYTIVGFAQAKVISVQLTGPTTNRGMTLQFEQGRLSGSTGTGSAADFGLTSWSVCSFESIGDCS